MTVPQELRATDIMVSDGRQIDWPFGFVMKAKEDVLVVVDLSDGTEELGQEAPLVYDQDYEVHLNEDQDNTPGGFVRLKVALPVGRRLCIVSAQDYLQMMKLLNKGAFYPTTFNVEHDRIVIMIQQLLEQLRRCVQIGRFDNLTPQGFKEKILGAYNAAVQAELAATRAEVAADRAEEAADSAWSISMNTILPQVMSYISQYIEEVTGCLPLIGGVMSGDIGYRVDGGIYRTTNTGCTYLRGGDSAGSGGSFIAYGGGVVGEAADKDGYRAEVLGEVTDDKYLRYYTLDDTTNLNYHYRLLKNGTYSSSAPYLNGSNSNGGTATTGVFDDTNGVALTASNDIGIAGYVTVSGYAQQTACTDSTGELWFKISELPSSRKILMTGSRFQNTYQYQAASWTGLDCYLNTDGTVSFEITDMSRYAPATTVIKSSTPVSLNEWHHLACVHRMPALLDEAVESSHTEEVTLDGFVQVEANTDRRAEVWSIADTADGEVFTSTMGLDSQSRGYSRIQRTIAAPFPLKKLSFKFRVMEYAANNSKNGIDLGIAFSTFGVNPAFYISLPSGGKVKHTGGTFNTAVTLEQTYTCEMEFTKVDNNYWSYTISIDGLGDAQTYSYVTNMRSGYPVALQFATPGSSGASARTQIWDITFEGDREYGSAISDLFIDGLHAGSGICQLPVGADRRTWATVGRQINRTAEDTSYRFVGSLDEIAFYDKALTAEQVQRHCILGKGSTPAGNVGGYLRFRATKDDTSGLYRDIIYTYDKGLEFYWGRSARSWIADDGVFSSNSSGFTTSLTPTSITFQREALTKSLTVNADGELLYDGNVIMGGAYLPITGGTLTGNLAFSSGGVVKTNGTTYELHLVGGTDAYNGGGVVAYGSSHDTYAGQVCIRAVDTGANSSNPAYTDYRFTYGNGLVVGNSALKDNLLTLNGGALINNNGVLTWNGVPIKTGNDSPDPSISDGNGFVRFGNGMVFQWQRLTLSGTTSGTFTFAIPCNVEYIQGIQYVPPVGLLGATYPGKEVYFSNVSTTGGTATLYEYKLISDGDGGYQLDYAAMAGTVSVTYYISIFAIGKEV